MRAFLMLCLFALAGCADEGAPAPEPVPEEPPEMREQTVVTDVATVVEWSGHTLEGVWLCGLPNCPYGHVQPSNDYQTTLDYEGALTHITLDLDWTPADATQTGLAIQATDENGTVYGLWQGSSSFTVDVDVVETGTQLNLAVWPVAKDGATTFIDVTQQPFTVTGSLTGQTTTTVLVPA